MVITETFFSVAVRDMPRATEFYVDALGATVATALPFWTSLHVAGVRVGLALVPEHHPQRVGLHFVVSDLEDACARVERAGGSIVAPRIEVAPGVFAAQVTDTEGNTFSFSLRE